MRPARPRRRRSLLAKALKLNPGAAQVLANLGRALSALNRDDEAMASLDQALAIAPDSFDAVNIRGHVLLKLKRAGEAVAAFERVLALEPRFLGARANLGNALAQLGRFEEALAQYDALLAAHPAHPEILVNRGSALAGLGRLQEALAAYDGALALRSDYGKARIGRGATLAALNRHQEALAEYGAALAADKNNADIQHNEALSLLTLGDYRRGFPKYEARWQRAGMPRRKSLGKPLWLGEYPLARKTILVHAEQGLGDVIQFARYVPQLARGGAKVVMEVHAELAALLSRLDGVASVVGRGAALPAYDVHCPVGSLPLALRTEVATIPANVPYLAATEERIAKWRDTLGHLPSPRIAVAWSGRVDHANDRNRSIALERFAPLLAAGQGSFVSIQRELRDGDADALARAPNVTHVGDALNDFDDTAAVHGAGRSGDLGRHLGGASRRRHGAAGVGAAAVPAGLALAARSRRLALVSDRAAVPSAHARRLGERDRAGEGRVIARRHLTRRPQTKKRAPRCQGTLSSRSAVQFRVHRSQPSNALTPDANTVTLHRAARWLENR